MGEGSSRDCPRNPEIAVFLRFDYPFPGGARNGKFTTTPFGF